jgi:hypothetical protein
MLGGKGVEDGEEDEDEETIATVLPISCGIFSSDSISIGLAVLFEIKRSSKSNGEC